MKQRGGTLALLLLTAACASQTPRPGPVPPGTTVKIGKPYQVFGVWYYPADDQGYDQTGIASWYGPGFHALSTANGERYDQDDLTAAHKTLPMPSYVEVHNLDNGRKLTVRVNDRGPFVAGRIIDLSRKSAQLLGVDGPGTARVRVRRVFPDDATRRSLAPGPGLPAPPAIALAPPVAAPVEAVASAAVPPVTSVALPGAAPAAGTFVQVAALSDPGRIAWMKGYLSGFGPVVTEAAPGGLTRMRLGPYDSAETAQAALSKLQAAGYSDARVILPR